MLVVAITTIGLTERVANASYPILKLDINTLNRVQLTEPGFTSFTSSDSGSTIKGITITLEPIEPDPPIAGRPAVIDARRRGNPTGIPYEQIYRDFIFSRPGGIRLTLSGLWPNQSYEITMWAFDEGSSAGGARIADWYANGEFCLTTNFLATTFPTDEYSYAFTGSADSDATGRIVLESYPNENTTQQSGVDNPYTFLNALVIASVAPITEATNPVPEDGVTVQTTALQLQWITGMLAVSNNVYFGEDYDDVENATTEDTDIFRGSTTDNFFLVGSPGNPYPTGLSVAQTYYWRIDGVNDLHPDKSWKGPVWSFTVPPKEAYYPDPVDGSLFADPNVTLQWDAGADAIEHHVYFGDNLEDVQAGTGGTDKGTFTEPNYPMPSLLQLNKTYYWRIDEYDGTDTHTGDVWSFNTTLEDLGTVVIDIWENIAGNTIDILKDYAYYPGNPDFSELLTEFGTQADEGGDSYGDSYGGRIHGWLYVPLTGEYTFYFTSADQGELWLSTDDTPDFVELLTSEFVWGWYDAFTHKSDPIPLIGGERYYIMAIWKEDNNWDHCQVAWEGPGIKGFQIIQGSYLSPYEPVMAYSPTPKNGSADVKLTPVLRWKTGKFAAAHNVYFGTDPNALDLVATKGLGQEKYDILEPLQFNQTYYWRIDETNDFHPDTLWIGEDWSFTTADFIFVDDFEDYNNNPPDRVLDTWKGGFGCTIYDENGNEVGTFCGNGTGSAIGHDIWSTDSPYYQGNIIETSVVHVPGKSMPIYYDNTATTKNFCDQPINLYYSEIERVWDTPQDWTQNGAAALTIWFQGLRQYVGGITYNAATQTYTMTGAGADIYDLSDSFHYAYKQLSGEGSITAKVESLTDVHEYSKAGVMIRETLDADSTQVLVSVTPQQNGVEFMYRETAGETTTAWTEAGDPVHNPPHWVRIRRVENDFYAEHSTDGVTWVDIEGDSQSMAHIPMSVNTYIGLHVCSHEELETAEAVFSNVRTTGDVTPTGPFTQSQDIGILSNVADRLYVILEDDDDNSHLVEHPEPNATQIYEWQDFNIDMREFTNAGVNTAAITKMTIGIGNKAAPVATGSGTMYFDDIRVSKPGCFASESQPEGDVNDDCVVDYNDIETLADEWLSEPEEEGEELDADADLDGDGDVDFSDYAVIASNWLEERTWPVL